MSDIILIQSSLRERSHTAIVVRHTAELLEAKGIDFEIMDLRELEMPLCDARPLADYPKDMLEAHKKLLAAKAFIFGMPVYCYSLSGPLKNFIDIHSKSFEHKYAGILCNAGGGHSYMASADLMKILSFESRCLTVQPTVYTTAADFMGDDLTNEKPIKKIEEMVEALEKYL